MFLLDKLLKTCLILLKKNCIYKAIKIKKITNCFIDLVTLNYFSANVICISHSDFLKFLIKNCCRYLILLLFKIFSEFYLIKFYQ